MSPENRRAALILHRELMCLRAAAVAARARGKTRRRYQRWTAERYRKLRTVTG
jgi:hypothetical protein